MPYFGDGSELEGTEQVNRFYLFVKTQIVIKYNIQVLSQGSDLEGMVVRFLGSSSGMM